ncbi:MAG: 30S ribosomal protein S12 methylthiotransferase RimO [Pseudomonadota bacterium]|nr:30S ribosomal protein S12 methylthiotransferase RimO [Pseudomonadota bacterium]
MSSNPRIGFVSLGCPKALVDTERILSQLQAEGYSTASDYQGSDLVVVNTCGFLDSAREESLEAIGEALTKNGQVVVTGCLGAEAELIRAAHPNVLAITGPHQYEAVVSAIHEILPPPHDPFMDLIPPQGIKLTPKHYAYLKISEGCNHQCSFCIIPQLRGNLVSRLAGDVLREAEELVKAGVQELLVISQDTSAYGVDVHYVKSQWRNRPIPTRMTELCAALGELGVWIRLHYVYPYPHVDELLSLMREQKLLPYLDVPFQHASNRLLRAMKRPAAEARTLERIREWRRQVPNLTIRSTFIVGFPGETEDDFEFLMDWLEEAELDRVGCFRYEAVDGAAANQLENAIPEELKEERWHRLMEAQQKISTKRLQEKIGQEIQVIIDEIRENEAIGRSEGDAPEIDGKVLLTGNTFNVGDIVRARVEKAGPYDLWATCAL